MPVNSQHPDYEAALPVWKRCRDVIAGSDAIKDAGSEYLPMLDSQDSDQYDAYKERALWYGATARTVQGLIGAIFRKDPMKTFPEDLDEQLDDITLDGVTLEGFAKKALEEILAVGRVGVLVDMPADDVATTDRRPYWVLYEAEQIINWKTRRIGGKTVLSLVVLCESADLESADEFDNSTEEQYRVLKLDEANLYVVEIWKERESGEGDKKKTQFFIEETITPARSGKRLDFIPFTFLNVNTVTPDIEKPPLLDLIDINLSHYRSTADYEHGLHFTGLPTPWATGFDPDDELRIGSGTAWVSKNENGKVGMLEFTGKGLGEMSKAIEDKEKKMAALGARMLEQQKSGVEAADTVRLRQSGEHGALQSISVNESQGLTKLLQWHAEWAGASSDDVRLELNKDFFDTEMSAQDLTALMGALHSGSISFETFFYNLQRGELIPANVTVEDERKLIAAGNVEPLDTNTGAGQ